jgi:TPR repeat protein
MFQGHIDQDAATQVAASAIPDVLFERGLYWASGRSGVVNLVAAHKWFNLAALKGRADAIRLRREVAELMSDVEIATAQREARAWMTAHRSFRVASTCRFSGAQRRSCSALWCCRGPYIESEQLS